MILYPTDFSEQSAKSFAFVLEFAKQTNQEITLIHVFHIPILDPSNMETGGGNVEVDLISIAESTNENRLKQFKDELAAMYASHDPDLIRVHGMIRMGFAGDEIIRISESMQCDYIMLTVKKKRNLEQVLFGNIASDIVKKSKTPVITIPENYVYKDLHRIAYATDLTFSDSDVISRLLLLAITFQSTVKCFHVHDSSLETENAIIDDFIVQYKAEANAGFITFQLIDNLNTLDGIDYFVQEHDIQLLCMVKQKTAWIDFLATSLTKQVVFHENIPVLIFQE